MSNTDVEHPEGPDEPCPAWYHGDHSGKNFEADGKHLSETVAVPVITQGRDPRWPHTTGYVIEADELLITVYRRVGDR